MVPSVHIMVELSAERVQLSGRVKLVALKGVIPVELVALVEFNELDPLVMLDEFPVELVMLLDPVPLVELDELDELTVITGDELQIAD